MDFCGFSILITTLFFFGSDSGNEIRCSLRFFFSRHRRLNCSGYFLSALIVLSLKFRRVWSQNLFMTPRYLILVWERFFFSSFFPDFLGNWFFFLGGLVRTLNISEEIRRVLRSIFFWVFFFIFIFFSSKIRYGYDYEPRKYWEFF